MKINHRTESNLHNDATEPEAPSSDQIKEALRELTLHKDKYQDYLKELLESGNTQSLSIINIFDIRRILPCTCLYNISVLQQPVQCNLYC